MVLLFAERRVRCVTFMLSGWVSHRFCCLCWVRSLLVVTTILLLLLLLVVLLVLTVLLRRRLAIRLLVQHEILSGIAAHIGGVWWLPIHVLSLGCCVVLHGLLDSDGEITLVFFAEVANLLGTTGRTQVPSDRKHNHRRETHPEAVSVEPAVPVRAVRLAACKRRVNRVHLVETLLDRPSPNYERHREQERCETIPTSEKISTNQEDGIQSHRKENNERDHSQLTRVQKETTRSEYPAEGLNTAMIDPTRPTTESATPVAVVACTDIMPLPHNTVWNWSPSPSM